jgi:hypothetical protein
MTRRFDMPQKTVLLISTALTAFVLFVGGALAGRLIQPKVIAASPTGSPEVLASFQQREAAYQDLIQQANDRLQQAYSTQTVQPTSTATTLPQNTTSAPTVTLLPAQAAGIAFQFAPGTILLSVPELVDYQGIVAYEVILNTGLIYVDANNGQVLYSSTAAIASFPEGENDND